MASGSGKLDFIKKYSTPRADTRPKIYVPHLEEKIRTDWVRKVETTTGGRSERAPEKVVLMIGETGVGKTTMINGMFNYALGVDWEDEYRVKLIEEPGTSHDTTQSQTRIITSYTINRLPDFRAPFTLKVIDMPGFGDTGGLERDKEIAENIKQFFQAKGESGIDQLHAVGFVIKADTVRFTQTQQYIFDQILQLFGKNIVDNMFILFSFSQAQKPQPLAALKAADVRFKRFFKFNNSAIWEGPNSSDEPDDVVFNKTFWEMGMKSFKEFMSELDYLKPHSLTLAKQVLEERANLESAIDGIRPSIILGLEILEELNKEHKVLKDYQKQMDENKDYEVTLPVTKTELQKVPGGTNVTICPECEITCHSTCVYTENSQVRTCSVMVNGKCKVCRGRCSWEKHQSSTYKYVRVKTMVTKTAEAIKKMYEEAKGKTMSIKQIIEECEERIAKVKQETLRQLSKAGRCIRRLNEIAYRPVQLTVADYVEALIQVEKKDQAAGWAERVEQLKELKTVAAKLGDGGDEDPYAEAKLKYSVDKKTSQVKVSWELL